MELTEGSETSANYNMTPGKYPKEQIHYSKHGESLKSRKHNIRYTYGMGCDLKVCRIYKAVSEKRKTLLG
jgi:hypothetical protein